MRKKQRCASEADEVEIPPRTTLKVKRAPVHHAVLTAVADVVSRDLHHAVRVNTRRAAFALTTLATLALGIGANTAMFSIADAVLFRRLPYTDPDAVVSVSTQHGPVDASSTFISDIERHALLEEASSFAHIAAYGLASWSAVLGADSAGGILVGRHVSPSIFAVLQTAPHRGRLFSEDDAVAGADRVILLSFPAWTNRFGSDPDIVGTSVILGGQTHEIVGVLAEGFYFPTPAEEFWKPLVVTPFRQPSEENPTGLISFHSAIGRLRSGVSADQAAAEARVLLQRRIVGQTSDDPASTVLPQLQARVVPLQEALTREYRPALLVLTVATTLVLLIACINISGLILARGMTQRHALAVRAALGASRGRLVRQLLTETLVLGFGGGVLGLAVAAGLLGVVPALLPGNVVWIEAAGLNGSALLLALGLSVVAGLVAGTLPAFQLSRVDLARTLNEGVAMSSSTHGFPRLRANRAWGALVVGQVAIALVLLISAGLLLRTFVALSTFDRGYDSADVVTARLSGADTIIGGAGLPALVGRLEELVRMPGVEAVGLSSGMPLANGSPFFVGMRTPQKDNLVETRVWLVSPGYFDALRLRVLSGRTFTTRDTAAAKPVTVVNETLARALFGEEPAVGQQLGVPPLETLLEVIGVVADVRDPGVNAAERYGEVYVSVHQPDAAVTFTGAGIPEVPFLAVRATLDPSAVVPFLRASVADVSPYARLDDVQTLNARMSESVASPRFHSILASSFASLALILAVIGIYGLVSYTVSERRQEVAVRMVLGARRGDIVSLVVGQGAVLVVVGIAVGMAAGVMATHLLESFLFGVSPGDRLTFVAMPLVLAATALLACYLPVRRTDTVAPTDALR